MKKGFYCVSVIAVLVSACLAFWPVLIVEVSLPKEKDRLIAAVRIADKDMITLRYRHSAELTWVEGRFTVGAGAELLAKETRFESSGSGLPNNAPERTTREKGWIVVDEKRRPVGTIRFYIAPINETRLFIAERSVQLNSLESGALIEISAARISRLRYLLMMVGI